jgi:hypothetical protein
MEIFPFGVSLFAFFHFFLSLITLNDLILKNQPFVVILDMDTTRDTATRQLINYYLSVSILFSQCLVGHV